MAQRPTNYLAIRGEAFLHLDRAVLAADMDLEWSRLDVDVLH